MFFSVLNPSLEHLSWKIKKKIILKGSTQAKGTGTQELIKTDALKPKRLDTCISSTNSLPGFVSLQLGIEYEGCSKT